MRHRELPAFLERWPAPARSLALLLVDTAAAGSHHQLSLYAPAIAYSLVISLAPILVGLSMFGGNLGARVIPHSSIVGDVSASDIWGGLMNWAGPWATVLAGLLVIFGASSLFSQLVGAVSRIWHQPGGAEGVRRFVRQRALAVLLVVVAGVALLASAVAGVFVVLLVLEIEKFAAGAGVEMGWLETIVANRFWFDLGFAWLLFVTAFTAIPRNRPRVRDVALGASITALGYAVGQRALSVYLDSASRFTSLGSFGGFLALLVWAYYTAVIVLWGAELTHQLALRSAMKRPEAPAT